ncbi:MAG: radical SAM protein, partial [Candidatus Aureabacteria bacterium]|nr:radical SAM protein [Candidatus Auribacterota bacterium]
KEHWRFIAEIKGLSTANWQPVTVLVGDHVTALPEESFRESPVDFVITGGDYDFLLANLCRSLVAAGRSYPLSSTLHPLSSTLEPGIWYRDGDTVRNTGPFRLDHDLDQAPFIDRDLSKWDLYAYKNGNYKRRPGTYLMSGRDCWWGGCSFCSWRTLYPEYRVRSVENVLDEIGRIVETLPVREIMDDTGTFAAGKWLRKFCRGVIERGYHRKVGFDCNFRFGAATFEDYRMMKKAGFRFLLFGLESGNQETLDRIHKNLRVGEIIESCRMARQAGLYPHITLMFGYPWENHEQARRTLELGQYLLKSGSAYTMQATIVVPYPGTDLYREARENNWLLTDDWSAFDMTRPVLKIPFPEEELTKLVRRMYATAFHPLFLLRKALSIRDPDDLRYFLRAGKKVVAHITDFRK